MNRLILFPKQETVFRSRVPTAGLVKFLFRSSHPVNVIICEASETDPKAAKKKYTFENYLCITNTLTVPDEWKTLAVHVTNISQTEKLMCEYEFKFIKKKS